MKRWKALRPLASAAGPPGIPSWGFDGSRQGVPLGSHAIAQFQLSPNAQTPEAMPDAAWAKMQQHWLEQSTRRARQAMLLALAGVSVPCQKKNLTSEMCSIAAGLAHGQAALCAANR